MRKLGLWAVIPAAGFTLACASAHYGPKPATFTLERAAAPEGAWSLGAVGTYFEIRGVGPNGRAVSIPLEERDTRWLRPESLRLGYWDAEKKRFDLVAESRFDSGKGQMHATVSRDGRYGVFGHSAWGHVRDFQRRLCGGGGGVRPTLDPALIDRICLVILCAPFDTGAWGGAWTAATGEVVSPAEVGGHFGDLCDRCLGHPDRIAVPECDIGVIEPGGGAPPPALEQIPNGIANGGRAVAIAVHPADDARLVVASETGGLFVSANRGRTWRQTSGATTFDFTDLEYLPSDPTVVIAAAQRDTKVASGGGIWRSADSGESWSQVTLTPPLRSCVAELGARALAREVGADRLWAGTTCGLARSDTTGTVWTYLPSVRGYANDKIYAVAAPGLDDLKILTDDGVKVTANGGGDWSVSTTGLPVPIGLIGKGDHNAIAVSPLDATHIYWSFPYWIWNDVIDDWEGRNGLYLSTDNGSSWSALVDTGGYGRPPFVRLSRARSGRSDQYEIYHGDGGCTLRRTTVTHGAVPSLAAWTSLNVDHCDASEVAFGNDGTTPVLLASDGGLHRTTDGGSSWTFTGGGRDGYNALQVTEVTGQLHGSGVGADLYFGTQDNDIWASGDNGITWPGRRCCEGFLLGVPRQALPADGTRFTGVSCSGCGNFISERLLTNQADFPNPPNDAGNPRLLEPAAYVQNTRLPGVDANLFNTTADTGAMWTPRFGFPEQVRALPEVAGPAGAQVLFTAYKRPGTTPDGEEPVGIKRITDVFGAPTVSDLGDFGSLGIFPTMFAWYKPFGVDPTDPSFLIVPDVVDDAVEVTDDGAMSWTPDASLTDLVTGAGTFRFSWGPFGQVSSFGFDPDCPGHVLVGTQQAGIFRSFDRGGSWRPVSGTEVIPRVSSFFFAGNGNVIASSYGRGLWRLRYTCPGRVPPSLDRFRPYLVPVLYVDGVVLPLASVEGSEDCSTCGFFLVEGGEVLDYEVDADRQLLGLSLSGGGSIDGRSGFGKQLQAPFEVRHDAAAKLRDEDSDLKLLLARGNQIRGVYLDGRRLKGLVVAAREVSLQDLPRRKVLAPYLVVDLPASRGPGLRGLQSIEVRGYGFDPRAPLRFELDGRPLDLTEKPAFDEKGVFRFVLPPVHVGGHTLRVEQQTARGTVRDAYNFNVGVGDSPPKQ